MNVTMPPSSIPILRATNGEILTGNPLSTVVLSSARSNWHNFVVEEHHFPSRELDSVRYMQHVVCVNIGRPVTFEITKDSRRQRILETGAISLFPSHHPFFSRRKKGENGNARVFLVAFDPVFISRTAAALEGYPDRVELVEQRGRIDPTLRSIAMALRDGLRVGRAQDRMYGEALSTALAVHMLREYCGITVHPEHASGELSREQLLRAFEYIHDQLDANLTVSGIARAVHMSPYHFTRLFKQSTGLSPYRYVIQARVSKAKELLTSGKLSIIEIAHRLGFADQSHLTRHLKNLCGVTPKKLQEGRGLERGSASSPQKHSLRYGRSEAGETL